MKCGLSRYKQKNNNEDSGRIEKDDPTLKVFVYFLVMPKLKRLFVNPKVAKNLKWYSDERRCDELFHLLDYSMQWKNINHEFP